MTTCRIKWIDENGRLTPDSNPAIGMARCTTSRDGLSYPICADHAARMWAPGQTVKVIYNRVAGHEVKTTWELLPLPDDKP